VVLDDVVPPLEADVAPLPELVFPPEPAVVAPEVEPPGAPLSLVAVAALNRILVRQEIAGRRLGAADDEERQCRESLEFSSASRSGQGVQEHGRSTVQS
jgi:hypothetical protein